MSASNPSHPNRPPERPSARALRLSVFLPIIITLSVWLVGAMMAVIFPQQLNLVLALLLTLSLVAYLVYWTRRAPRFQRLIAIIFILPGLLGIAWGTITGTFSRMLLGVGITALLLVLQRLFHTPLSYRAAFRHFEQGNMDAALHLIHKSIDARPDFWQSYQMRALIYLMRMQFTNAERDAQRAATLRPDAHPVYNTLGQIYLAQNRFSEAAAAYTQALEFAPESALYQFHLGLSQYRLGDYQAAAAAMAAATQGTLPLIAYDLQSYYYLGRSLEALGDTAVSAHAFTEMKKFGDGLRSWQDELASQPDYPHLPLLQADLTDLKERLRFDKS